MLDIVENDDVPALSSECIKDLQERTNNLFSSLKKEVDIIPPQFEAIAVAQPCVGRPIKKGQRTRGSTGSEHTVQRSEPQPCAHITLICRGCRFAQV